jgi:DNA repair exonuclease SbcCD ATPase subunit
MPDTPKEPSLEEALKRVTGPDDDDLMNLHINDWKVIRSHIEELAIQTEADHKSLTTAANDLYNALKKSKKLESELAQAKERYEAEKKSRLDWTRNVSEQNIQINKLESDLKAARKKIQTLHSPRCGCIGDKNREDRLFATDGKCIEARKEKQWPSDPPEHMS